MRAPSIRFSFIFFIAAAAVIAACSANTGDREATPADPAGGAPEMLPPSPTPDEAATLEIAPGESGLIDGVQRQVAGGLVVEASNWRFEEEDSGGLTLKLDLCIPIPTDADWLIHAASLRFAGTVIEEYGGIPIEIVEVHGDGTASVHTFENGRPSTTERPALENEQSYRCDTLYFWGLPEEVRGSELKVTINGLYASRLTGVPCSSELLAKAQQEIDALAGGIVLSCSDELINGYAGLAIERIPEGVSLETAEEVFHSDAFYLAMFGVAGPWEFVYPEPN